MNLVLSLALIASLVGWRHARALHRTEALYAARIETKLIRERRAAEEQARDAEARLETARQTMLSIAESLAADCAARSAVIYAPPVRALPRTPVSVPAPACVVCARYEVQRAVLGASRAPVAEITGERGWKPPFVVRWGDA